MSIESLRNLIAGLPLIQSFELRPIHMLVVLKLSAIRSSKILFFLFKRDGQ